MFNTHVQTHTHTPVRTLSKRQFPQLKSAQSPFRTPNTASASSSQGFTPGDRQVVKLILVSNTQIKTSQIVYKYIDIIVWPCSHCVWRGCAHGRLGNDGQDYKSIQ